MSDTSHVLEATHMTEGKGFFERLLDFSFQYAITQKYAKLLYGIHLLLGLIVGTWYVFTGFQTSTSQGLLTLLLALVGYFLTTSPAPAVAATNPRQRLAARRKRLDAWAREKSEQE